MNRPENINYLKFLAYKFHSAGWSTYSNILERYDNLPVGWIGPEPEILFIKRKRSIAVCIESLSSLKDDSISEKWKAIIKEKEVQNVQRPGTTVTLRVKPMVLLSDIKTLEIAKRIAETHSIPIDCQIIKKVSRKRRKKKKHSLVERSKTDKLIILVGILIVLGFLYVATTFITSTFKKKSFFQPAGTESDIEKYKKIYERSKRR